MRANLSVKIQSWSRIFSSSILVAIALLMSGCPEPSWPKCENDKHCRADKPDNKTGKSYFCINGMCRECRTVQDCPNPERQKCENNTCVDKTCADITCPENKRCNETTLQCEWICENDGDTPCDGDSCKVCKNHQCVPIPPKCTKNADCPGQTICQNPGECTARCVPGCAADKPCPEGQECVAGRCQEKSCTPQKIYFDYNKWFIRSDARDTLRENMSCFQKMSGKKILIEGHCDERGTREYNLQLGRRRARATKDFLVKLGIPSSRICTVSKGEEEPEVPNATTEEEHQKNRRAVFKFVDSCP